MREDVDGEREDDRRVLLRGYRVEGLQGGTEIERERVRRGQEGGRALDTFAPEGRGWKGCFTSQTDEERVTELTQIM